MALFPETSLNYPLPGYVPRRIIVKPERLDPAGLAVVHGSFSHGLGGPATIIKACGNIFRPCSDFGPNKLKIDEPNFFHFFEWDEPNFWVPKFCFPHFRGYLIDFQSRKSIFLSTLRCDVRGHLD